MSNVEQIVRDVAERGDAAVREWSLRLDDAAPVRAVPGDALPTEALLALADAVRRWHELQRPPDIKLEITPGVELERRWVPLRSVGIYVPRGLVSTLVMCAVPAQVAGVERIVVMTPPEGSGLVAAAAEALGADAEMWAVGGPQAIAALAYGTDSIERVDKIVGPGNAYVNEAKLLVSSHVAIDLPAGPSEVVVLVGQDADRQVAELELAAQAEHGPDTICRIVNVNGDLEHALVEIEALAPEHLVLLGVDAEALAPRPRPGATGCRGTGGGRGNAGARGGDAQMRTLPAAFAAYKWAPSTEELARRVGVDPVDIVRFDGNVPASPAP